MDTDSFVIKPFVFKPKEEQNFSGTFASMNWNTTAKKNGAPRRDLVLAVELDEKDESGNAIVVEHTFNLLPGGRGASEFAKQIGAWKGSKLTDAELANFKAETIMGKPVTVVYAKNHLGRVCFGGFLPATE